MTISGTTIMHRIDTLATISEDHTCLTRTFLTARHREAGELLAQWMKSAGMQTRFDAVGNMIGRYEGTEPGLPALVIGSHYDTVRNAGKYDGLLGILAGISCIEELNAQNELLPFAIEIVGFSEEEGVRFGATLLGSRGFAGSFDIDLLEKKDADKVTMADAFRQYGLDPDNIPAASRQRKDILAYVEAHIEQGPVLLAENLPVGVVTSIAGATRFQISITGPGGHAGTVPMLLRCDALAAAAEIVTFVEHRCIQNEGMVGTVGQLRVINGAANTIPATVEFSIDIRAGSDSRRLAMVSELQQRMEALATKRRVAIDIVKTHEAAAAHCNTQLMDQLDSAIKRAGFTPSRLISGAGHDAMAIADLTQIAMLFVRCGNEGISHHPDETMTAADAETTVRVLLDFIRHFEPVEQ